MIFDGLQHWWRYQNLAPSLQLALSYLHSADWSTIVDGRHELSADVFAMVSHYSTKLPADAVWESHRKYVDVQYVIEGEEWMGYASLDHAPPIRTPYDGEKDVQFYQPSDEGFRLRAGQFAIFYPEDIHAPGLSTDSVQTATVRKVVLKVAMSSLTHVSGK